MADISATTEKQLARREGRDVSMDFIVTDSVTNIRAAAQKCQHLMGHFSCSVKATHQLHEKLLLTGVLEHCLICNISTHWNSTYAMLEHLVEKKRAMSFLISETEVVREKS
ncbi:UNVERIFIED_CONTAM: hypothetical protein K2H54_043543 [Gekko kuhli]